MLFGRIKCFTLAVINLFKNGRFVQHFYKEEKEEPAIIIATDTNFRVSHNYQHELHETVYPNATLIHCKCERCGHTMLEWKDNSNPIPVLHDYNRE